MAKGYRICKVCGREYEYCRTQREDIAVFRWQDVACCPEHGSEYFARVMRARGEEGENLSAPQGGETYPVGEAAPLRQSGQRAAIESEKTKARKSGKKK